MRFRRLTYALIALILLFQLLGPNFHFWLKIKFQPSVREQEQQAYSLFTSSGETVKISTPQKISTISGETIPEEIPLFVNDLNGGDKVALQLQNYSFLRKNHYLNEDKISVIVLVGSSISHNSFALSPLTASLVASLRMKLTVFDCQIISTFTCFPFLAVELPYREIFNLASQDFVAHVFLDTKVKTCLDESVPLIKPPTEWNQLETQFGFPINGSGIRIAILDSGIDTTHPDLDDLDDNPITTDPKVIAEACFTGEGYTQDNRGHGTHCASIAAGTGNASGYAYVGVAPGAYLLNAKVIDDEGSGAASWIISGIEWAVSQSADIISMSLGFIPLDGSGDGTDPLSLTVDWAVNQGVVCTVAAGNYGALGEFSIAMPGVAKKAITVGATNQVDFVHPSSCQGPTGDYRLKPDLCAPGVTIIAARANNTDMGTPINEYYTSATGTSMATPHVAGAAALILQIHPSWKPLIIKSALMGNAMPIDDIALWKQGAGRIQVCAAVNTTLLIIQPSTSFGLFPNTTVNVNTTLTFMNLASTSTLVDVTTFTLCDQSVTSCVSVNETTFSIPAYSNKSVLLSVELDETGSEGWFQGRVTTTTFQNNKTAPYFFVRLAPPNWNQLPNDQVAEYGYLFQYTLNASDRDGIDTWWLNDTSFFVIDASGIITNRSQLSIGIYHLQVWVNDTLNYIQTASFRITVQDTISPVWTTTPEDQVLIYGELLGYRLYATDKSGIASWSIDDITRFSISSSGLLTNIILLEPGEYSITITVYDFHNNSISATITITVQTSPPPPPVPGYPWTSILLGVLFVVIPALILRHKKRNTQKTFNFLSNQ